MDLSTCRHLDPTEVAVLIRKAFAVRWPGRKFKVRTQRYAGGASVSATWEYVSESDTNEARRIATQFHGRDFDGATDYAFPLYHWLAPGPKATLAYSPGAGVHRKPGERPKPCEDAELFSFGVMVSCGHTGGPEPVRIYPDDDDGLPF